MGLADPFRRFFARMRQSDEDRLREEIESWAARVPGTIRIDRVRVRERAKLAGVVKRITVHPAQGNEALEALITDGSGEIRVVWMGRRSIPGLTLGTRVVVEGLIGEQRAERRMVNPSFEFSA